MTRTAFLTVFVAAALLVLTASANAQVFVTPTYVPRARVITTYSVPAYYPYAPRVTYVQPYSAYYAPVTVYPDVVPYTVASPIVYDQGVSVGYRTSYYPVYTSPVVVTYPRRVIYRR